MRTINIALIVAMMQKNNIQTIYFGINTHFVEDGVAMIQSITYVKPYEDKNNEHFTPLIISIHTADESSLV
jgi:hypothetical protein